MRPTIIESGRSFRPWFDPAALPKRMAECFKRTEDGLFTRAPGLFAVDNRLGIILPRCYSGRLHDDAARTLAAQRTIRVLARYYREKKSQRAVLANELELDLVLVGDVPDLLQQVDAALALWDDWQRNGPLTISSRQVGPRVRGRVLWPATIATSPQMVSGHNVLYAEPVQTRHALDPKHPLAELHAATCAEAGRWLGWIDHHPHAPLLSPRDALDTLDRHERALFQDRHRATATLLRRYYAPSGGPRGHDSYCATGLFAAAFYAVWEHMLTVVLGPRELPVLPEGVYSWVKDGKQQSGARYRLDLLIASDWNGRRIRLVLDAKDYEPGSLPDSEDINKQILYRFLQSDRYIRDGFPLQDIGNAFVMPALVPEGHRVLACHDFAAEVFSVAALGRIVCLELDFARAADAYALGRSDSELRATVVSAVMSRMG